MATLNRCGSKLPIRRLLERLEERYGRARMISRFDPMEELVSCMLSQHTTDATSFPTFTKLRETFPDWHDVVEAGPERLADVIRGAGLANQKSKNIIGALQKIHEACGEYSLEFLRPQSTAAAREWLMTLPGVGPKTASIVLCFAMGRPAIPVDTHVYRVSWRIGVIPEGIGENKAHDLLLELVPSDLAFRYHTALIQHGRLTCRAPSPLCDKCEVTDSCRWFQAGRPNRSIARTTTTRMKSKGA
jgi:endonuclease-3